MNVARFMDLQQVNELALLASVLLCSFYMTIFALVHGTIHFGILGIALVVIGLSVREVKGMV